MTNPSLEQQINSISLKLSESIAHKKREEKFAKEANERFSKNFLCFEKYFPDVAKAITNFQTRDDFCIHVTTTGFGNFIPEGHTKPLYSDSPIEQSEKQVLAQIENPVYSITDYSSYPVDRPDERIHCRYMSKLAKVMIETKEMNEEKIKKLPSHFPTAIIFGIGLGYHVPLLLHRTSFDYIFLVEPNFEQFFASLFCTDWFEVIEQIDKNNGCLFFQLGADKHNFINDLESVADDIGAFSVVRSFCYQHTPDPTINLLIKNWIEDYFRFQFGHGFYNDAVTGLAHSIHHVEKKTNFLQKSSSDFLDSDVPIFIIGNGPSLDEADEFIRENASNAIVIAAGTAVASMYKKGIPVDFHVLVERPYANYKIFGDILPDDVYEEINLLGLNTLYPDTVDRYKWAGIATKGNEAGTFLLDLFAYRTLSKTLPLIPFSNPVVANTALSFSLFFGFKNVYLFGVDNGNQPCGSHHSKDSVYKADLSDDESDGLLCLPMDGRLIPGNLGRHVISNELFQSAHLQLEKLIAYYPKSTVINVGNGAKLKGAIPIHADDLLTLKSIDDKESIIEKIKHDYFNSFNHSTVDKEYIAVGQFNEICDHLVTLCDVEVATRHEASDILQRQSRYLYTFRDSLLNHLFHLLKGALLYYHCPMITLLYSYTNEEFTLKQYGKLNEHWKAYILEMRDHYALHYKTKCDFGKE
jgi:hypothetical protein